MAAGSLKGTHNHPVETMHCLYIGWLHRMSTAEYHVPIGKGGDHFANCSRPTLLPLFQKTFELSWISAQTVPHFLTGRSMCRIHRNTYYLGSLQQDRAAFLSSTGELLIIMLVYVEMLTYPLWALSGVIRVLSVHWQTPWLFCLILQLNFCQSAGCQYLESLNTVMS